MVNAAKLVKGLRNINEEAAARYNERADSAAKSMYLLKPDDVAGEYDANRLLLTTLGGQVRPVTREDLQTFKRNAEMLGKAFKGGITPKQVIDRALQIDRDRSKAEIPVAIPAQYANGKMHFTTSASKGSDVTRHHVLIEFANYSAGVSSPSKSSEVAAKIATGPVKFSCDCGRHTFWYSYLATIGKFNSGVPQLGYPKIRNPKLVGVACKHVLRVMVALSQPMVRIYVAKMIDAGRRNDAGRVKAVTQKDARALIEHQKATAHHKRNQVETSSDKRLRLAQQRAVAAAADKSKARTKALTPEKFAAEKKRAELNLRRMATVGLISAKMLASMLKTLNAK